MKVILKVYGKVQGVFFRDSTCKKAEELNLLSCRAENELDGTVRIIAEGKEEDLKRLIEWCRASGPEHAEVEKVDVVFKLSC